MVHYIHLFAVLLHLGIKSIVNTKCFKADNCIIKLAYCIAVSWKIYCVAMVFQSACTLCILLCKPFGEVGIIRQQYLKLLHQLGFCGGFFAAYLFYFLVDGFCAFGIKSPGHKFFEQNAIQYFYFHYKPIFILLAATVFFSSITLA